MNPPGRLGLRKKFQEPLHLMSQLNLLGRRGLREKFQKPYT